MLVEKYEITHTLFLKTQPTKFKASYVNGNRSRDLASCLQIGALIDHTLFRSVDNTEKNVTCGTE